MAIAGRVAIVPKGEWSQSVTYDKLDLVTYNGNTFIAYKSSVGVEPVDGDTWMLVMQGIDPQEINNIIDGTTPVGDSNKLGGKGANEYALGKDVRILTELPSGITKDSTMQELIEALPDNSILSCRSVSSPLVPQNYSALFVIKPRQDYVMAFAKTQYDKNVSFGGIGTNGKWEGWTTGFLPLGGGTASGDITVDKNASGLVDTRVGVKNTGGHLILLASSGGNIGLFDEKNSTWVLKKDSNGNMTINGNYTPLHTGNKPSGTYTGNATKRTIDTGCGSFGQACIILDHNTGSGWALITRYGGCGHKDSVFTNQSAEQCAIWDGVIHESANSFLNISGHFYEYRVI